MTVYQCFRRDKTVGKGGGVLMYGGIRCEDMFFKAAIALEHIALKVVLCQQMSFTLISFYRPPTANFMNN